MRFHSDIDHLRICLRLERNLIIIARSYTFVTPKLEETEPQKKQVHGEPEVYNNTLFENTENSN